ncbi:MAG: carbon dioxide concentrating mechanism protein CcmL [Planctomycetaceae bacterium]|jgi:ethanolamine utilization protein EutN|nr:carbon dioxide concentrating mechanism protein CcmL [Planctomycetaceae bacterium]
MRIGKVIGQLTLSRCHESVRGFRWKIVVPMTEDALQTAHEPHTEELIVYDDLSVGEGQRIAFSEGAEASMPFFPNPKPLDAYNAAILDQIELTV